LPNAKDYDADLLHWLEEVCAQLASLSEPQKWGEGVVKALALLQQQTDETAFEGKDGEIYQEICNALRRIESYEQIRPLSKKGELLQEINYALESLQFHETEAIRGGVLFTDAVRMRGVQAKIVFVLGLNDQSFPAAATEDPILRDYYRYILRDVLGYWINKSLDRLAEEKLLFFLTVTAAQEKLYVLYSRQNDEGKDISPSLYAAELARATEYDWQSEQAPRQSGYLREKIDALPTEFLTAKELSYAFILSPKTAHKNYEEAGLLTPDKANALQAALRLADRGELNEFDGQIGPRKDFFERENEKGFSPSALEKLAKCPMQYFFEKGLHLGNTDDPLSREELARDKRGSLLHDVLHDFYGDLSANGQLHNLFDSGLTDYLNKIIDRHFRADGYRTLGLYPLVWEIETEKVRTALSDFVVKDVQHLGTFVPYQFERETTAAPTEQLPIRLYGRIDRIDIEEAQHRFFVVDYKSTGKGSVNKFDSSVLKEGLFQPFLYVYMLRQLPEWNAYVSAGSALLSIFPEYKRYVLTPEAFETLAPRAYRFFTDITNFVKRGQFFIVFEKKQCSYCPYNTICRKDSFKSLLRSSRSDSYRALQEARY
jgi:ATP-dependent helicase/DNAse subunit B